MRLGSWSRLVSEITSLFPSEKSGKCDMSGVYNTNAVFGMTDV